MLPDLSNDAVDSTSFGVVEYMGYALSAIYSMIGGLSFEGLPFGVGDIGQGLNVCLYYGSSIVAGLIVLSVITAKASYEIFSLVTIRFLRRRRTVYVFNGLTKDSLLLAQNIAEHHQDHLNKYKNEKSKNTKTEKPRKALIIFAGNNISAFSRTEPLCRDVMSNSCYYYSLMKGKDTKKSLLTTLGLRRNNVSLLTVQPENALNVEPKEQSGTNESRKAKEKIKGSLTRIAEFYFTLDDDKKPMQEKNTTDAFSEVDFIVNDLFYGKKPKVLLSDSDAKRLRTDLSEAKIENADSTVYTVLYRLAARNAWTITEQYVLTHGDINYQYYTSQITERVEKIKEHLLDLSLSDYFGKKNAKKVSASGLTGAEAARKILDGAGLSSTLIAPCAGSLTDHYDPRNDTVYLSESVYNSNSVAAIGVAAHEVGHAIQHAEDYAFIKLRTALVPITNFTSRYSTILIMIGLLVTCFPTVETFGSVIFAIGILFYACYTLFTLVTLPVEFNASHRALRIIEDTGIAAGGEISSVRKVLSAAASTYLMSFAMSFVTLLRFIAIFGSSKSRRK